MLYAASGEELNPKLIKFFRTTWIVIVNVDGVPTYKNVFHNLTLF